MSSSKVISSIFFSGDKLLRMEELAVRASSNLVNNGWLQIEENTSRYMLPSASFGEESVESVVASSNGLVTGHLSIRLNTVFQAEELPAGVAYLDSALSNVD